MSFLPSVLGSGFPQKADGNGAFIDALPGLDFTGYLFKATADQTITNTTTETTAIGTGIGSQTLPANWLTAGRTLRLDGGGIYSAAVSPGNLTIKIKLGTVVLASVVVGSLVSGASSLAYNFDAVITCRATGTSGTVLCHGMLDYNSGIGRNFGDLTNAGVASTVDTTIANLLTVTATWQTASASNILKNTFTTIEAV